MTGWCALSEKNCGLCSSTYCQVDSKLLEDPIILAPEPEPVVVVDGKCYNPDCGCPGNKDWPEWCTNDNYSSGWCSLTEENCALCNSTFCLVNVAELEDPIILVPEPVVAGKCYNSDCGCPGNAKWPGWCKVDNYLKGWCSKSEENCGLCNSTFCPNVEVDGELPVEEEPIVSEP